jgi:hypothetical protein
MCQSASRPNVIARICPTSKQSKCLRINGNEVEIPSENVAVSVCGVLQDATQAAVFEALKPTVDAALVGMNATILTYVYGNWIATDYGPVLKRPACRVLYYPTTLYCGCSYGQTGSGKTYTLLGNQENPGIVHRTLDVLHNTMTAEPSMSVKISMVSSYDNCSV